RTGRAGIAWYDFDVRRLHFLRHFMFLIARFTAVVLLLLAAPRDVTADVSFEMVRAYVIPPLAISVVTGDFNRDGAVDVVVVHRSGAVSLLFGDGHGGFQPPIEVFSKPGTDTVVVGDLNGDGFPDLVVGNTAANSVSVLLGDGAAFR